MFIKVTRSGKYEYAQLVQSYREDGRTKHKVLLNLGRVDEIENNPSFQRLALRLEELSKAKKRIDIESASEGEVVNWGYIVYKKLWQGFGLDGILSGINARGKAKFSLNDSCFLMALQHLLEPRSKLGTFHHQGRYLQLSEVGLNHLYRSLDMLQDYKEELEEEIFFRHRHIFNMKVDVVFFDVTTFYFESVRADTLRDFGFSKDGKPGEVQVVMALLVDCEGRPIGYELFPGNTFESKTLESALEKLEKRFGLRRVIIVADKGINSKLNLKSIKKKKYDYIVASRIRKMSKKMQEKILDPVGYIDISSEEETLSYKVLEHTNQVKENGQVYEIPERLVLTYSSARAQKDRSDRERILEKARGLLQNQSKIKASNKRGGKKYLKEVGNDTSWVLDEEAIQKDAMFDGYYGIQTSDKELGPRQVLEAYHTLWKIEESFRLMKSTLEVRPVFHWTEPRIKGHFVICFLAFLLERTLESRLKEAGIPASPEKIREALNSMCFFEVEVEHKKLLLKTKGTKLSKQILRILKMKPPKNVVSPEELSL